MKRTVLVLICALSASCALFASFDGHSSLSGVYDYNDGTHYLGIGSDSFGFVNDFPLGYYAGIDASFSTQDISDWRIGMIAGPAYSYDFGDSGVSCDVAAGKFVYYFLEVNPHAVLAGADVGVTLLVDAEVVDSPTLDVVEFL